MIRILLPVLLLILGIAGGVGAGLMQRPEAETQIKEPSDGAAEADLTAGQHSVSHDSHATAEAPEYVKFNNQFVVPVVTRDLISAMIVLSLSVEIVPGTSQTIYDREPKLRDAFLQVLFDHANMGGFEGAFTNAGNMDVLRKSLTDVARRVVGDMALSVLITDIARQDV
ncbi:MAG: flagellar basal body-associated protein FliL [Rhodobacteraceae bacterium CG17_big_fil_post_rev_8_21_14_2_50_63_15]|nr:flagellar basal body-associated protein FliL [Roseovarius sp.]PIV77341.1 MAG: flagellar basal body-associated protein FliL [Rhodobacteraceae bacterium CG17_big_fil_post_rev_8_21_14_2_50_63_15]